MHKKAIALLMAMSMLFIVTGCDPQDSNSSDDVENTSSTVTDSSVIDSSGQSIGEDTAGTDPSDAAAVPDTSSDTETDANSADNETEDADSSQQETEQSGTPMQVQDNLDVNLSEGEEGAW